MTSHDQGAQPDGLPDLDIWVLAAEPPLGGDEPPGSDAEVEQHALFGRTGRVLAKADPATFLESWKQALRSVQAIFAADQADGSAGGFVLESVTAKLSLTATGKVAFIGELGGEVAFEAQFKRRD